MKLSFDITEKQEKEPASKDANAYQDTFAKQDPKKLAGLVKNYLKQE